MNQGPSNDRSRWSPLRAGLTLLVARRGAFARLGLLTVALVVGLYLFVTLGNSWLFSYNFYSEVAPSDTADQVAVLSLWGLALFEAIAATVMFGALCALGLGASSGSAAIKASLRVLMRLGWWAVPSMIVAALAVVFVAPAPYVVGELSALTCARLRGYPTPRDYLARVRDQQQSVGFLLCGLSFSIWITVLAAMAAFPIPAIVDAAAIVAFVIAVVTAVAWTAASSAQIYLDDQRPPPVAPAHDRW